MMLARAMQSDANNPMLCFAFLCFGPFVGHVLLCFVAAQLQVGCKPNYPTKYN
ncbi:hypothetical protein BCR44DRAFT_1447557, partial [Catenaria anguillulae PL171]